MASRSVNPEPFRKFAEFVANVKPAHIGRDIAGNSRNYVPLSALQEYWTPKRISRVLHAFPERLDLDIGIIRRQYLRIFSTLVYSENDAVRNLQPLFISRNLSDGSFPWRNPPSAWPDEKFFRDVFAQIAGHQWQFFPLHFRSDRLQDLYADDECILPIDPPTQIAYSNTTSIERFDIHDDFNHLEDPDEQGRPTKKTFVFKVYHSKRHEEYYENELRALRRLSVRPSPNVVKFYGSFRQLGSYCLILEYVDGGDLGGFFDKCPAPSTVEDVVLFWKNIFQVFSGLDRIHQLMAYNDDEVIKGIHEDIRPENILLMKGPSGSPYDFTPKIADFGLYSRVRTARARASGSMGLDNNGNQRFSAPECCHHTIQRHMGTNMITTSADIFSMGAVLSHTTAWVIGGFQEQVAYFRTRTEYHATTLPRFQNSGYEGCFHDSIDPLPIVIQQHKRFRECCRASDDDVTPEILNWVEECMLVRTPKDRLRARVILEKFEQFMGSRCRFTAPPPASPSASPVTEIPTATSEPTSSFLFSPRPISTSSTPATSVDTTPISGLALPVLRKQPRGAARTSSLFSNLSRPLSVLRRSGTSRSGYFSAKPRTVKHASPPITITPSVDPEPLRRPPPQIMASSNGVDVPAESPRLQRDDSQSTNRDTTSVKSSENMQQPGASQDSSTSPSLISANDLRIRDIDRVHSALRRSQPVDQPTADLVEYLEHNLGGRDQFFFIDDSRSMLGDKNTILEGFRALACIAKRLDPDKVELAFASQPRTVYKATRMKTLEKLVKGCQYRGEGDMMEARIGELINNVIIPQLPYRKFGINVNIFARKPVSVYVFTDGNWGDASNSGNACGVERPVRRLIGELQSRGLDRTQVSLHFVRFGDKENGRKNLERLDECGRPDHMDIVDVKHISTEVVGMFVGPITRANDDIPAQPNISGAA